MELEPYSYKLIEKQLNSIMENNSKKIMKVTCYLNKKKLCELNWDQMPNIGMSFNFKKREYMIIDIKDSKITLKDISKKRVKRND